MRSSPPLIVALPMALLIVCCSIAAAQQQPTSPDAHVSEPVENADAVDLRQRADRGEAESQYHLGSMYATGDGVDRDDVEGHMWFTLAVRSGQKKYAEALDDSSNRLTAEQLANARRRVQEWLNRNCTDC